MLEAKPSRNTVLNHVTYARLCLVGGIYITCLICGALRKTTSLRIFLTKPLSWLKYIYEHGR